MVDFHCHLDLYPDTERLIAQCDEERVATLAVTTTPKAWPRNRDMAANSAHVRVALGIHPQLVAERPAEMVEFERYLVETRYVGEVGLDAGPRHYKSFPEQKKIFEKVLRLCADRGNTILTIHSVRAVTPVLDMLEKWLPPPRGRSVLHWFTGTRAEARRAVDLGCYFSINAKMLDKPTHRALVAALPEDRLLTETDGPFVSLENRPTVPSDVRLTVERLAAVRSCESAVMAKRILANLSALLR